MNQTIQVVAGIIYDLENNKILIARKKTGLSHAGLWEFPGGKVEPNESLESALKRELREELNIEIENIHAYLSLEKLSNEKLIQLHSFECNYRDGEIILKDHDKIEWVEKSELKSYAFSPMDILIVEKLSTNI